MKFKFYGDNEIEFDNCVIAYLKEKIAHNMAYKTVQPNRFDRRKYKFMIMKIITMRVDGKSYVDIGRKVNRSSERIRQITYKFFRRLEWCIKHNNQPIYKS